MLKLQKLGPMAPFQVIFQIGYVALWSFNDFSALIAGTNAFDSFEELPHHATLSRYVYFGDKN